MKSTGVFNYSDDDSMKGIKDTKTNLPELKNDGKMYVYLQGNYFKQNNLVNTNNNKAVIIGVINIDIVYKLDPIASRRDTTFTIQNALFGAMQITKNADTSKYDLILQILQYYMLWVMDLHKVFTILRYM